MIGSRLASFSGEAVSRSSHSLNKKCVLLPLAEVTVEGIQTMIEQYAAAVVIIVPTTTLSTTDKDVSILLLVIAGN